MDELGSWEYFELTLGLPLNASQWKVELQGTKHPTLGEVINVFYDEVSLMPIPERIPGDANHDFMVNDLDAAILATYWQYDGTIEIGWEHGDFNGDGKVTDADAAILAAHWQEGVCEGATSVPEPSTFVLLAMAGVGLLACTWPRRRWIVLLAFGAVVLASDRVVVADTTGGLCGIHIKDSGNGRVGQTIRESIYGIYIQTSGESLTVSRHIISSRIFDTGRNAIRIVGDNNVIALVDTTIRRAGGDAVVVKGNHNMIRLNGGSIQNCRGDGLYVAGSYNVIEISGGDIADNTGHGVNVVGKRNTINITGGTIRRNARYGLRVVGVANIVSISGGTIQGTNGDDIAINGLGNKKSITGGTFGDSGVSPDEEPAAVGYLEKMLFEQGLDHFRKKDYAAAISSLKKAIELNPTFVKAHNTLGNMYSAKGDYEEALSSYDRAISLKPSCVKAYVNRGNAHNRSGDPAKAIEDHTTAISLSPPPRLESLVYFNRSLAHSRSGNKSEAASDLATATLLAVQNIGLRIAGGDDSRNSTRGLKDALRIRFSTAGMYAVLEASDYRKLACAKAIDQLTDTITADPSSSAALNNRGVLYLLTGYKEKALADFSKAIELAPDKPCAYYNRGRILEAKEELDKAGRDFMRAKKFDKQPCAQ